MISYGTIHAMIVPCVRLSDHMLACVFVVPGTNLDRGKVKEL